MKITAAQLSAIAGGAMTAAQRSNIASILAGLDALGAACGLDQPHRLLHYIAQIAHESGRFVYDKEVWGPTPAQARYDTRADLGNTPALDGDGKRYAGRGPMQITGAANYRAFRDWCLAQGLPAPDFVASPELVNTDPWEGIGPLWYWSGHNLNRYADANDIEMVTRKINGGVNGLDDRIALFVRTALVMLGRSPDTGIKTFQAERGLSPDGIAGPRTRQALFDAVKAIGVAASAPIAVAPASSAAPSVALPMPAAGMPALLGSVSKAIGAAKGAAKGSAILPVLALIGTRSGMLPLWLTDPEVQAGILLVGGVLAAAIWAAISTYHAPPNGDGAST